MLDAAPEAASDGTHVLMPLNVDLRNGADAARAPRPPLFLTLYPDRETEWPSLESEEHTQTLWTAAQLFAAVRDYAGARSVPVWLEEGERWLVLSRARSSG